MADRTLSKLLPTLHGVYSDYRKSDDEYEATRQLASYISLAVDEDTAAGIEPKVFELITQQINSFMAWEAIIGDLDDDAGSGTAEQAMHDYRQAAETLAEAFEDAFLHVSGWTSRCMSWCPDSGHPAGETCRRDLTQDHQFVTETTFELIGKRREFAALSIQAQPFTPGQADELYRAMTISHDAFLVSCHTDVHARYPSLDHFYGTAAAEETPAYAGEHASWCGDGENDGKVTHTSDGHCSLLMSKTAQLELHWVVQPGENMWLVANGVWLDAYAVHALHLILPNAVVQLSHSQAVDVDGTEWGGHEL